MTPDEYRNYLASKNLTSNVTETNSTYPRVMLDNGYKWTVSDGVQAPFAFFIGVLHALPTASFGFRCSKNMTSALTSLKEGINYFNQTQIFDGVQSIHDFFSYFDEIGMNCYWAFATQLTETYFL